MGPSDWLFADEVTVEDRTGRGEVNDSRMTL